MIKAILFDFDGILYDSEKKWKHYFYKANKEFHLDFDEKLRLSLMGKKEKDVRNKLRKICPNLDVNSYRNWIISHVESSIKETGVHEIKDAYRLVHFAKERGLKTCIVSGNTKSRIELTMLSGRIRLNDFDAIVCADDQIPGKPFPDSCEKGAKLLNVKPEECIMIDDGVNGVKSGLRAGCKSIWVNSKLLKTRQIVKNCWVCKNLTETKKLIEKLIKI